MLGILADNPHDSPSLDYLAFVTHFFYRCPYFHVMFSVYNGGLFGTIYDPAARQVIGRQLDGNLVTR